MIRPRRSVERPLVRRDAEGRERTAASWESLTERLIREAVDAGAFADLPYRGRPLRLDEDRYAGDMALANHLLRNAGVAPPWIETDKEARRQLHALEALLRRARRSPPSAAERLERELDQVADAHDDAVARLEALAPSARQHRGRLDRTLARSRLRAALGQDRPAT